MDIEEFEEQVARRASERNRTPTRKALEGAEQAHLRFNDRLTPAQMDREHRERERARVVERPHPLPDGWSPQKGELVWARFDRWCAPGSLTRA